MDKSLNKNTQQPYIPRGSTVYKPVIPEKKPSDEIVNNLFLVIADGNYFKIKEHMFTHNVLMTSKNGSGESALHVIIKNTNISSHEKKELVQLAIMKGAQVNAYDINNVSPLHLACKFQYSDIIKLLLSHGANINALDNQFKSPLHYATIGESTECPQKEQIKPLIPKTSSVFKINKTELNDNTKELNNALSEFFTNDVKTTKFISQMKSSFENIQEMFSFTIKELQNKNKQEIIDSLINSSANDTDKKQEIFSKIMEIKTSLSEHINLQVKSSVDQMLVKANLVTGWGPDSSQQNKVLPNVSLEDFISTIDKQLGSDRHTKIMEMQQLIGALDQEVYNLNKYNDNSDKIIGYCQLYSYTIGTLLGDPEIVNMTELRDLICESVNPENVTVNVPIINENLTYNFMTGVFTNAMTNVPIGSPIRFLIKTTNTGILQNPSRIRILENEIKGFEEENGRRPLKSPLDLEMNVGGFFAQGIPLQMIPVGDNYNNPGSNGFYFNSKIKFYTYLINNSYRILKNHLMSINSGIDSDPQFEFPFVYETHIAGAVTQLLTITLLLSMIYDNVNKIRLTFDEIYRIFARINGFETNQQYLFLREQIEKDLFNIANEDLMKMCSDMYESVQNIVKSLNGMISFMENMSASKCIDAYFKYDTFDNFYESLTSPEITNIMAKPLKKIKEFPSALNFVNASGPNIIERRKDLIENYMLQVTLENLPTGVVSRRSRFPIKILPKLGYLPGANVNIQNLVIDTLDNNKNHGIKIVESGRDINKANDPDPSLVGSIACLHSVQHNKNMFSYPIIGQFYAIFLNMIKYAIMRYVINLSYNFLTEKQNPANESERKLNVIIKKLNNEVKQIVKFDDSDYGFILTMIGRTVDKYLINFINENIAIEINKLLMSMIRDNLPAHHMELINSIFANVLNTTILTPDNGLSLGLDELFDELLILHQENLSNFQNRFTDMQDIATITIGNLNEEYVKTKKIHKITNFDSETQIRNEICYKYDQDVIKALLEFNAKVNLKDAIGNTPLYYAIETGNILAIKQLVNHGAIIYSTTSTNKFGKCALEHAWDLYATQLQKQIGNKMEICNNVTDKIIQKLKKNEKHGNNIPKYSTIILPMTLYLLNHQIYLTGKGYANGWNFSNNEEFEELIGLKTDCVLPLLEVNLDMTDFEPKSQIESAKQQLNLKNNQVTILINRRKSLIDELTHLNTQQAEISHIDILRIEQIQESIQSIDKKLYSYDVEINSLNNKITSTTNFSQTQQNTLKQFIENNKMHFRLYDENVTDIYNSVFVDVINNDIKQILDENKYYYSTDIKTYPLLWKKYFQNIHSDDYTQVVDLIVKYQKKQLKNNSKTSLEKVKESRIISQYYFRVINPFCEHYFELEQVYGETNYIMTKIINIIVHVIKHTLCVNLFGFIVKSLTKFMLNTIPKHQYTDKTYAYAITQLVIEILDANKQNTDGSALMNYIFNIMPLKLVKSILQIYEGPNEGEDDLDKRLTPESIFNHINKILESSTTMNIKDKSSLLLNLKEYVYPFYIDYSTQFIKEMKNLIDSYMRQLQGDFNMLNILEELSQK